MNTVNTNDTGDMRRDYRAGRLNEAEAGDDPVALFARWFDDARRTTPTTPAAPATPDALLTHHEANVMTLATVDAAGRPDARIVLLKEFGNAQFVFYTNCASAKGEQLTACPHAALVFHWPHLERQVRVRGSVERVSREQAEAYFRSRPLGSQIGAAASEQSRVIADRAKLESRAAELREQCRDSHVPMPDSWGGYRVTAEAMEFWQGRADRLHDRLRYTRHGDAWRRERLSP